MVRAVATVAAMAAETEAEAPAVVGTVEVTAAAEMAAAATAVAGLVGLAAKVVETVATGLLVAAVVPPEVVAVWAAVAPAGAD